MDSLEDELSLGLSIRSSIPITIGGFPRKASKIKNVAVEKGCKLQEHVKKLAEEKRKIQGSELELPLSLQILSYVISYFEENNRCSEVDTKPLLKDFISINEPIQDEHNEEEWREGDGQLLKREELVKDIKFQLRRGFNDHILNNGRFSDTKIKNKLEIKRSDENSSNSSSMLLNPGLRTPKVETGLGLDLTSSSMVNRRRKDIVSCCFTSNSVPQPPAFLQQQSLRKQRRCWTPELHGRFVDALQQLGGPELTTPKQIREHMQEKGLTNDEVKSHLQKYRLHIKKNPEKQSAVVSRFNLWNPPQKEEETGEGGESSKRSNSQSDSPQGPLQLPSITTTTSGDNSMKDAEDDKSESLQMERLRSP